MIVLGKIARFISSWIISLLVAIILILSSARVIGTPLFIQFDYATPNFPPDPYGFTLQQRLHYANLSLQYLLNNAGISFLGDLKFTNGTPVFNERELSHMVDVKHLIQAAANVWIGAIILLVLLGLILLIFRQGRELRRSISRGGWLSVGIVALIMVAIAISFNTFFTDFHRLFFTGNSWLFYYSDTLIRLFPLQFWIVVFTAGGVMTLVGGLLLGILLRERRAVVEAAQESRAN
ncbi:MAG: TIGR01906 family membrane protein [Chloroflexi bacterium]|nr:TIGR01906 family membrane protein [Chloroflexota bacterium]